ncbi:DNA-processing protein DprA [uncultured Campylobacter sp.]|uniref:DNA-processing protein DprA n=1 Tax=uncultured Campylobacter sp. TaxID=218934 RepID=UPI0026201A02|nr:DNA-processing protein DprA [uncultured Campylobacter sp.]
MNFISEIEELKKLKNPPKKLYYKGNLKLLKSPKIAIVGSRKMTVYTKNLVFSLASKLKNAGVVVVSGGALGVDIVAHEGAYPNTIGVFANGLNIYYPQTNRQMIEKIYQNSLALSAYDPDEVARKYYFLERNKIVVALSSALVVAQAALDSGSMRSAKYALELGIPIYVLPQKMFESDGTNYLLANNKARLIYNIDEFIKELGFNKKSISDPLLADIEKNGDFDTLYEKFGEKLFWYELEGKIAIDGNRVIVL